MAGIREEFQATQELQERKEKEILNSEVDCPYLSVPLSMKTIILDTALVDSEHFPKLHRNVFIQ